MSKNDVINHAKLQINQQIYDLVVDEIIPKTGIDLNHFWDSFQSILERVHATKQSLT